MKRRLLLSFATLVISAGLCQSALAVPVPDFTLSLSNANQGTTRNNVLTYSGTITNTTGSTLYLQGIEFNYNNSYGSVDTNPSCTGNMACIDESFFYGSNANGNSNVPAYLTASGAGSTYTGILFNVDVPLTSAITTFSGFVDITGGTSSTANNLVSTIVGFSTTVTPEPSSWLLMATGLLGLVIVYRIRPHAASSLSSSGF